MFLGVKSRISRHFGFHRFCAKNKALLQGAMPFVDGEEAALEAALTGTAGDDELEAALAAIELQAR